MAERNWGFLQGEVATLVYSVSGLIPVGAEVEVVKPLRRRDTIERGIIRCYGVFYAEYPDTLYVTPDQLRKLDPPGHPLTLVQWSECPWQPRHEHSPKETAPR